MGAPAFPILPQLRHPDPILQRFAEDLCRAVATELAALRTPVGTTPYAVTGAAPSRTLDAANPTLPTVAALLVALVADLKTKGTIA